MLVIVGTRKLDTTSLALRGFRRLCPTATAGAFWIFKHTEHSSHATVYTELLCCLPCGPDNSNRCCWEEFAEMSWVHVSDNLARYVAARQWKGKGKGKGATTSNSSPYAASSGVRQVEGNS